MGKTNKYYNLREVCELLEIKFNYKFHYMTVYSFSEKGYLKSSIGLKLYTEKDIDNFVKELPILIKAGKVKLQNAKKPENN